MAKLKGHLLAIVQFILKVNTVSGVVLTEMVVNAKHLIGQLKLVLLQREKLVLIAVQIDELLFEHRVALLQIDQARIKIDRRNVDAAADGGVQERRQIGA